MKREHSLIPAIALGLVLVAALTACTAAQMQTVANDITAAEKTLCQQAPMALVAAQSAQAGAVAVQQAKPGTDADKAVAAANLTVAALSQAQAFCSAKGYK